MTQMQKVRLGVVGAVVLIGALALWYFFLGQPAKDRPVERNVLERVGSEELGITFGFESGPTAFSYVQSNFEFSDQELIQAYAIMETERQNNHLNNYNDTDTPPAISVLVFQLPDNASRDPLTGERISTRQLMEKWLVDHEGYSNVSNKTTELEERRVDGENSLYYESQAAYPQATYIIKSRDKMYLITAQYETLNDRLYAELQTLIDSVHLE